MSLPCEGQPLAIGCRRSLFRGFSLVEGPDENLLELRGRVLAAHETNYRPDPRLRRSASSGGRDFGVRAFRPILFLPVARPRLKRPAIPG